MSTPRLLRLGSGIILLIAGILLYNGATDGVVARLLPPALMGLGALLILEKPLAVALTFGTLTAIHTDRASTDPLASLVYPVVMAICAAVVMAIIVRRFRSRIQDTHELRWAERIQDTHELEIRDTHELSGSEPRSDTRTRGDT